MNMPDMTWNSAAVLGPMTPSTSETYTDEQACPANMAIERMDSAYVRRYGCTRPLSDVCRYGMMVPRYTPYTTAPANTPTGEVANASRVNDSAMEAMDRSTV